MGCGAMTTAKTLAYAYDVFTIIVSLLDVLTDIIVLVEFYVLGRMPFFYASLSILIVAQLAYCIAFWFKFKKSFESYALGSIGFCCMLPFAPILSFAFFFTENDNTRLSQYLHGLFSSFNCQLTVFNCCSNNNSRTHSQNTLAKNNQRSPEMEQLRQWFKQKIMKHIGFIIEALIEAFPQSILQLIAIVYFNDSENYISMFSILLSMLSVSTKSFILSVLASYNLRSAIFNWLCCVTDFFGIFLVISFAFYIPPNHANNPFATIQKVWIYSILVTIIPFALIGSIGMNIKWSLRLSKEYWCGFAFFVQIAWIVGLCICVMSMTISCFLLIAALMFNTGVAKRISSGIAAEFYLPLISFINDATNKNMTITLRDSESFNLIVAKKQDKIVRICCINRVLLERMHSFNNQGFNHIRINNNKMYREQRYWTYNIYETDLHRYLIQSANIDHDYPYCNVVLTEIKKGKVKKKLLLALANIYERVQDGCYEMLDEFMPAMFARILTHIFLPLYLFGRIFNIMFVVFIICYLSFGHNIHILTDDVPIFQTVMFCCYILLLLLWIFTLFTILKQTYLMSFILPATKKLRASEYKQVNNAMLDEIFKYYKCLIWQPVAKIYCVKLFGKDIAILIMEFYGHSKIFDYGNKDGDNTKTNAETALQKGEEHGLLQVGRQGGLL